MITAAARAANREREVIGPTYRECPICGSLHLEYEFLVDKSPVCGCQTCGLLFLNPAPEIISGESYSETSRPSKSAGIPEAAAEAMFRELLEYSGMQRGKVLVIGEDDHLIPIARQRGFEAFPFTTAEVESGAELPSPVDLCICAYALEKMRDPLGFAQTIRKVISDGGALLVIAPTTDNREARLLRSRWWESNRRNRFYFSIDTLQNLLLRAGFGDSIITHDRTRAHFLVRAVQKRAVSLLSVIVPVYNEKSTFSILMEQLLGKSIEGVDIEIIVVESNSTDGTRDEVKKYADHPRVKILLEEKPMGKGHAVIAGLALAQGDILLIQDADLEYDVNDYDALVAPLLRYESNFVMGSRHNATKTTWKIREFTDSATLAAYFNLGHVLFLSLFNFLYKQQLTDPFTMFKVFRRDCIYGLTFECNRFDLDNEIVIKLVRKGYKPLELPVNYVSRSVNEGKKVTLVGDPLRWLRALVKFRNTPLYGGRSRATAMER
jgi:hypothetical protein